MIALALVICLGMSLVVNALLIILYARTQQTWMQMFRAHEGIALPAEQEVVKTAQELIATHQQRRKKTPVFSVPLPGTEWMKKPGAEQ